MRGLLRSLATLLLCFLPTVAFAQAVPTQAIDTLVADALKAWQVPGAALVLVQGNRVLHLKGYGVREQGRPETVTPDTVFPLASCTKAFTTAALALLVDDGKLDWDDPVRTRLEYFHLADPLADGSVTLRDLVSHRTGVAGHDLLWYRAPWNEEELVRRIGRVQPSKPFRSSFQYQSIMFNAAGLAVARTAGQSWEAFVRNRLLEPLGMTKTTFTTPATEQVPERASPHRPNQAGTLEIIPWYRIEAPNSAGSINSTARDLASWLQFQASDGEFQGKRLASVRALGETHRPQTIIRLEGVTRATSPDSTQMSYAMGWVVQDYRGVGLVSHAGAIDGFRAHLTLVPRARLGIAILSNRHETRMNLALSNNLLDLLLNFPARDWNGYYLELIRQEEAAKETLRQEELAHRVPDTKPSRPLGDYAGVYEEPAYGTCRVLVEKGHLVWVWSSFRCPLEHVHFDTFVAADDALKRPRGQFRLDLNGKVAGLKMLDVEFKRISE